MGSPEQSPEEKTPHRGTKLALCIVGLALLACATAGGVYYAFNKQLPQKVKNVLNFRSARHGGPGNVDPRSYIMQGISLLEKGDPQAALIRFNRAKEAEGKNPELARKMGDAFFALGTFDLAEKSYREVAETDTTDPQLMARLGLCIFLQNRLDEGISMVSQSVARDSLCGECYNALGRALSGFKPEQEGAAKAFLRSLALAPANPDMHYYYAKYLMEHRQDAEAMPVLKQLISLSPLYVKAHARLGMLYYYGAEYGQAKNEYELTLRLNRNDFNTWYNLGELYCNAPGYKNDSMALVCFSQSIRLNPSHAKANFKIGCTYLSNGRYKEAIRHLYSSYRANSQNIENLLQLGAAYEKLGRPKDALAAYKKVLEIDKLNSAAKLKMDTLTSS